MSKELTMMQWRQLESYAIRAERDGWYYGNKAQFEKRHEAIMNFLNKQICALELRTDQPGAANTIGETNGKT